VNRAEHEQPLILVQPIDKLSVRTSDSYQHFLTDHEAAAAFADECRQHQHDDLLLQKPGSNRGTPI
jgi:hypothetical protein